MTSGVRPDDASPIVIGALGGSGTRVLAEALIDSGVDLGREFNRARDNLVFSALFKRPGWFATADDRAIHRQLDTFVRYARDRRFGPGDYRRLAQSVLEHDPTLTRRESAARVRLALRRRPRAERDPRRPWGWKEPNSHLFLPQLIDHFGGLRYVYVARHGLDMAYSANLNQLRNFGARFGIPFPPGGDGTDPDGEVAAQLDFWIAMTRRAFDLGTDRLGDRFLFVRYDDLCRDPRGELERVLTFAGVGLGADFATLAAKVHTPPTAGRWRTHPDPPFTEAQVEAVRAFGFEA